MKRTFEQELTQRLEENRKLMERQFVPHELIRVAAFVVTHLFFLVLAASFFLTVVSFWTSKTAGLQVSKTILLLR